MDETKTLHESLSVDEPVDEPTRSFSAPEIERFERHSESPFHGPQISWGSTLTLAIAWVASIAVLEAIAPAPDPTATLSGFEMFMTLGYTAALMVGAIGLALRQRIGVMAAIAGGGLFVLGSVSCWMGGHVGSWIAVQAVLGGVLMLLGTGVLRRG